MKSLHQPVVREDDAVDPHPPLLVARDAPAPRIEPFEGNGRHDLARRPPPTPGAHRPSSSVKRFRRQAIGTTATCSPTAAASTAPRTLRPHPSIHDRTAMRPDIEPERPRSALVEDCDVARRPARSRARLVELRPRERRGALAEPAQRLGRLRLGAAANDTHQNRTPVRGWAIRRATGTGHSALVATRSQEQCGFDPERSTPNHPEMASTDAASSDRINGRYARDHINGVWQRSLRVVSFQVVDVPEALEGGGDQRRDGNDRPIRLPGWSGPGRPGR